MVASRLSQVRLDWSGATWLAAPLAWSLLFATVQLGRATPWTVSRSWATAWVLAFTLLVGWLLLVSLALRRVRGTSSPYLPAWSAAPLVATLPLLVAAYLSDDLFHFLSVNPIPRSLVSWGPLLGTLTCHWALLVWYVSRARPAGWLRARAATPILLFGAFAVLYVYSAGGHLYSPDESQMFFVTRSLAERGSMEIPRDQQDVARGAASFWHAKYGLVTSLLGVPAYWLSQATGLEPDPPSPAFPTPNGAYPLVDLLVNPFVSAATCVVLYLLARELGYRAATALVVAAAYGLATTAWVYAKTFLSQPPAALFLLAAAYLLIRGSNSPTRDRILAGISLGLAMGTRAELVILAAPIAALSLTWKGNQGRNWITLLIPFLVALVATAGLTLGWYNYAKTGSILATGHGGQGTLAGFSSQPLVGIVGTLASPGFGLFLFNPVVMPALIGLPGLIRRNRIAGWMCASLVGLAVMFYGSVGDWHGGFTWGSRYLVSVLPFALLPLGAALESNSRRWGFGLALAAAIGLGIAINFLAVLFDFNSGWQNLWDHRANLDLITWDPAFSPILAHLRLLRDYLYTGAKLDLYIFFKLGVPSLLGFLLLLATLTTLAVRASLSAPDYRTQPRSRYTLTVGPGRS